MEINAIKNFDNLNKVVLNNETQKNDKYNLKNGEDNLMSTINKDKDYAEFSIDYSNDDVHNIINNIVNSFDFVNINDNRRIADCAGEYGKILKSINSSDKIDDKTKEKITKLLDDSFDRFADKKAKYNSEIFSNFFNGPYRIQEYIKKNGGLDFGITGDKLIDKDATENNIRNIFTAAKIFYKNNLDGTKEDLDKYLEGKFNRTESIDKLGYDDFKSLEKSGILNWDFGMNGKAKEKADEMNEALENIKKSGASEIVTDTFKKACYQNNNSNQRTEAFWKIGRLYEKRLEMIGELMDSNSNRLKELDDKRKKLIEEHKKQIEKFKKDMMKIAKLNINGQEKILKQLEKAHTIQLENIDKQKIQIEDQQNQLGAEFAQEADGYGKFLKNPSEEISQYISNPTNNEI